MTREHKLALILGFAVIMIVGVLVGDHFSRARATTLSAEVATPAGEAIGLMRDPAVDGLPPVGGVGAMAGGAVVPTTLAVPTGMQRANAEPPSFTPVELKMGHAAASGPTADPSGLAGIVPVHAPAAAQTETVAAPGTADHPDPSAGLPVSAGVERRYVIESGDSLYRIADEQYGDASLHTALAAYNKDKLPSPTALRVGVTLRIPPKDVLLGDAVLGPAPKPAPTAISVIPSSGPVLGAPGKPATLPGRELVAPKPAGPAERTYTVKAGDTLGLIAKSQLGTSKRWKDILDFNRKTLERDDQLKVGMVLKIPAK